MPSVSRDQQGSGPTCTVCLVHCFCAFRGQVSEAFILHFFLFVGPEVVLLLIDSKRLLLIEADISDYGFFFWSRLFL
jgi:hypothetical protein